MFMKNNFYFDLFFTLGDFIFSFFCLGPVFLKRILCAAGDIWYIHIG